MLAVALLLAVTASDVWLKDVEPIISSEERKTYRNLSEEERQNFIEQFWLRRQINREEYGQRLDYIDNAFGSGRRLSGSRTDRGRVYLSLGAPTKFTRLASSRTFFPCEIWYYDTAPGAGMKSAIQLLFFQKSGTGEYRLYSPVMDTIRALMNP